jgi:hypothetical protein
VGILQVLAAHLTEGASRKSILTDLRKKSAAELSQGMNDVREALKRAVDFLITEVNVKSSDFLPYDRQLVVLAYIFTQRRSPSPNDIEVLRRWFWRTSYSERYRRGGEGLFDEDLVTVLRAFEDQDLLTRFGRAPEGEQLQRAEFRKGSALSNAFVATLASNNPRNLLDGAYVDTGKALSSFNRKEFHHIFPQAFLRRHSVPSTQINSLCNICMLNAEQNKIIGARRPSDYFAELRTSLSPQWDSILESNLIPRKSVPALLADDFNEFLHIRSLYIARKIEASI